MAYLSLKNVSKIIKHQPVLHEINLDVEKGEIVALAGENGSGKTMLCRAVLAFIKTSGTITLDGKKVVFNEQLPVSAGTIIETPNFIPNYTALDNLKYLAAIRHQIGEAEIIEAMQVFGLDKKKDQKVRDFSLGMRQKLAIVQAFMEKPDLLVLDEPTNALDAKAVGTFINLIKQLQKAGITTLFTTHDPQLLSQLPDRCYHLVDGGLEA